ncbi:MAG: hypothetical protein D6B28_09390 [Gammaproteobacteria bacterium]|nr:MAG: hypothetical protein D6B28_09390 [Gammaproteobacteria bacterium]
MRIYSSFVSPNHDYLQPRYSPTAQDKAKKTSGNSKGSVEQNVAQAKDNRKRLQTENPATNHISGEGILQTRESINLTSLTSAERQLIIELRRHDKENDQASRKVNPKVLTEYIENSKALVIGASVTQENRAEESVDIEQQSFSTTHDLVISESAEDRVFQEAETISYNANQDKIRFAQEIEDLKTSDRLVREGSYVNLFV